MGITIVIGALETIPKVTQTPVKTRHQTLVWKSRMEYYDYNNFMDEFISKVKPWGAESLSY